MGLRKEHGSWESDIGFKSLFLSAALGMSSNFLKFYSNMNLISALQGYVNYG